MKIENFKLKICHLLLTLMMILAALPARAQTTVGVAAGYYGATFIPIATNVFGPAPSNSIPASSTNSLPASYVYTNIYSNVFASPVTYTTNIITNNVSGYIDTSKQDDIVVQIGFYCTNTTDVSNVVFQLAPSADGINPDSTNGNRSFYITNTSPGSNVFIGTTVFSAAQKAGICGFFLTNVINLNTNPIFPALTNQGGIAQFMSARGRKSVGY